ncbi:uncharacterized protein LAESUDRAFT_764438 [Laetiporus sulphureus 93-53]|uniref:Uncharacterized protein n=1 Tax=Laetiporus sulphureus 93-53 TaxID=1314785 RepID=A0A165BBJ7_9APHY|nr:uncharacterized protein LAESUDRAFT_764438 [Laetiporus sulphureus 93-53]KZT00680.1 hypothetical protein LAESUDRAFT_764438 [Laetiporus sulphureus 93-53]
MAGEDEVYTRLQTLADRIASLDDVKALWTDPELTPPLCPPSCPGDSPPAPPQLLVATAEVFGIAYWFDARFKQSSTNAAVMSAGVLLGESSFFHKRQMLNGKDFDFDRRYPEWLLANGRVDWLHKDGICPVVTYLQLLIRRTPPKDWTHDEALHFARNWAVQEAGEQTAFVVMAVTMGRHVARTQQQRLAEASDRAHTRSESHSHVGNILHALAHWGHWPSNCANLGQARGYDHIQESLSESFALDDPDNVYVVQEAVKRLEKMGLLYAELLSQNDTHACAMASARSAASQSEIVDVLSELGVDSILQGRNELAAAIQFWKDFIMGKMDMTRLTETGLQAVPNGQATVS